MRETTRIGSSAHPSRKTSFWRTGPALLAFAFLTSACVWLLSVPQPEGYERLFVLPASFVISLLILHRTLRYRLSTFLAIFVTLGFLRFGVMPVLITVANVYGGRSPLIPNPESFDHAILLMAYEVILASLAIAYFSQRYAVKRSGFAREYSPTRESRAVYMAYLLGMIAIWAFMPNASAALSFVAPSATSHELSTLATAQLFGVYFVIVVKQLMFLIVATWARDRYRLRAESKYVFLAVVAGVANISVYAGTNRSDLLITAVATGLTLMFLFGAAVRLYLVGLAGLVSLLLVRVTEARDLYRDPSQSALQSLADTLQVYLGGPYNVAIAIETKHYFPNSRDLEVFLMDIFRPMIGPNLIVRNFDVPFTNVYFNARMFYGTDNRSQILPMIGQGYIHFGYIVAPVLTIAFVWLAYKLTAVAQQTSDPKIFYFLTLGIIRLGFMMGQNTTNMINDLSMNLFLFLILYGFARFIGKAEHAKVGNREQH